MIYIKDILLYTTIKYKIKMMLTLDEYQDKFSSSSIVGRKNSSLHKLLQQKISIQKSINIDIIIVESLLRILLENKKSPDYFKKIIENKDLHFTLMTPPTISLLDYIRRILYFVKLDISTVIIAMIYIDRICKEKVFLNEFNIHRILIISIYIAYTYNEDVIFDNNYLSLVSGMNKNEILALEEDFLDLIDFNLFVNDEEYEQYKIFILNDYIGMKN